MTAHASMTEGPRRQRMLQRSAALCAALVLLIAALSAFLRLDKSGLGCQPWPACYGQVEAAAAAGDDAAPGVVIARLAHRTVASVALVLVILIVMVAVSARPLSRSAVALALGLLATVLFLAGLGWVTRGSRLPAVALGNLLGGFAMLALAWRLAADAPRVRAASSRWAAAALAALVLQVTLGGLVSTTFADLSCGNLADCARVAAQQGWPWAQLDPWREPAFTASTHAPINPGGALVQLLHRAGALVVLALALPAAWLAWRHGRTGSAVVLMLLLLAQLAAGVWLLTPAMPLAAAWVHNLLAALMVALLARLV